MSNKTSPAGIPTDVSKKSHVSCDREMALILLEHAISEKCQSFSLAGLRVPSLLLEWNEERTPDFDEWAAEDIFRFEARLLERIASQSGNFMLTKYVRAFVASSGDARSVKWEDAGTRHEAADNLAELVFALVACDAETAVIALHRLMHPSGYEEETLSDDRLGTVEI